ncbi:MAG: hypothetical protein FJ139_05610 [Deltaproteobacteria bacterium]|nr:hypothetical protein [Deltaproteobacteria bacterium]
MKKNHTRIAFILTVILIIGLCMTSCREEGEVISRPDEYTHIYDAREEVILQAIAKVFQEKGFGKATIDPEKKQVESEYVIQDEWRTKSTARVKKISWKECEVTLSVTSEKKTSTGWELRRLLEKKQYDNFFDAIELKIYEEMYKTK